MSGTGRRESKGRTKLPFTAHQALHWKLHLCSKFLFSMWQSWDLNSRLSESEAFVFLPLHNPAYYEDEIQIPKEGSSHYF